MAVSFSGQWVLPVLTALVAGDTFSSEDHFGTWKSGLARSRTRGEPFTGTSCSVLLGTAFGAWHGLRVQHLYDGPILAGMFCSVAWFGACSVAAWAVFDQRSLKIA